MQENKQENKIRIIFGTTASGKTDLAIKIAKDLKNPAILNADSMQIYKEIPIITNQPTEKEKQYLPHYLLGYKNITEHSDLEKWLIEAGNLTKELQNKNHDIILVGGTGMYLKAITEGVTNIPEIPRNIRQEILQEIAENGIGEIYKKLISLDVQSKILKPQDTQRIIRALEVVAYTGKSIYDWQKEPPKQYFEGSDFEIYFINIDREKTYEKINLRFKKMVECGAIEEAKNANTIFEKYVSNGGDLSDLPAHKAHGLRELISYNKGEVSLDKAIEIGSQVTRNYAKRQLTWWRSWVEKMPKNLSIKYI